MTTTTDDDSADWLVTAKRHAEALNARVRSWQIFDTDSNSDDEYAAWLVSSAGQQLREWISAPRDRRARGQRRHARVTRGKHTRRARGG